MPPHIISVLILTQSKHVTDNKVIFFQTHRIAQHVFRGILHICPCRLFGTKAVSGKAIHTRIRKILQQSFGILLLEISNDNSFGFDIYFLLLHVLWDYLQNVPIKSDKAIAAMTIASIAMIAMNISIDSRLIVSIIMLFIF